MERWYSYDQGCLFYFKEYSFNLESKGNIQRNQTNLKLSESTFENIVTYEKEQNFSKFVAQRMRTIKESGVGVEKKRRKKKIQIKITSALSLEIAKWKNGNNF